MAKLTQILFAAGAVGLGALGCAPKDADKPNEPLVIYQEPKITESGFEDLKKRGVPSAVVWQYNDQFIINPQTMKFCDEEDPLSGIELLYKSDIMPEEANPFDSRFDAKDVQRFDARGRDHQVTHAFDDRFQDADPILRIFACGKTHAEANKYSERLHSGKIIADFVEEGISYERENAYDPRFSWFAVQDFEAAGMNPGLVNSYHEAFYYDGILLLDSDGITPEIANPLKELEDKYNIRMRDSYLLQFKDKEISYKQVEEAAQKGQETVDLLLNKYK